MLHIAASVGGNVTHLASCDNHWMATVDIVT